MTVKFIAEFSSNHQQDLKRCLSFIDIASQIGCSGVKFQLFKLDQLFLPEVLRNSKKHRARKAWELPLEFIPVLSERARVRSLRFGCTPFYLDAVDELLPYVDFFKIASYELLWHDLITACARTGKPLVLSTGMANMNEVTSAVSHFEQAGGRGLTLLHCVSHYPTLIGECNLAAIDTLRERFHCDVGWSDHSVQAPVLHRAIHRWNASMVEFHLDIDGKGAEFASGHCWLPEDIASIIDCASIAEKVDGVAQKQPAETELLERLWRADPSDGLRPLISERYLP